MAIPSILTRSIDVKSEYSIGAEKQGTVTDYENGRSDDGALQTGLANSIFVAFFRWSLWQPRQISKCAQRLLIVIVIISLTALISTPALSANKVGVQTVTATFPDRVSIIPADGLTLNRGEIWMVVKATCRKGSNWDGFYIELATVKDTTGNSYAAKAVALPGKNKNFYMASAFFDTNATTALFLFSIPAGSTGLKFNAGSGDLAMKELPPTAALRP